MTSDRLRSCSKRKRNRRRLHCRRRFVFVSAFVSSRVVVSAQKKQPETKHKTPADGVPVSLGFSLPSLCVCVCVCVSFSISTTGTTIPTGPRKMAGQHMTNNYNLALTDHKSALLKLSLSLSFLFILSLSLSRSFQRPKRR